MRRTLAKLSKAGLVRTTTGKTGTGALYGAGVGIRLGMFGIRFEYEYFDVSSLNRLQMYSVSGVIQF